MLFRYVSGLYVRWGVQFNFIRMSVMWWGWGVGRCLGFESYTPQFLRFLKGIILCFQSMRENKIGRNIT